MIHITVNILKFGNLGVKSAPYDAFEVIHFKPYANCVGIARVEVQKSDYPELKVSPQDPREIQNTGNIAAVATAILGSWNDEASTNFSLSVSGAEDSIEFVLSGRRKLENFWWRSQIKIVNGEVVVAAPALVNDPHT